MPRPCSGLPALLAAALALGSPAGAQDADDWDFGEDPARKLSVAAVTFEAFGVAVRCTDGSLSVVMFGLPAASGRRTLDYRLGEASDPESPWVSGRNSTTAFSIWPRSVAQRLSLGGRLNVAVPDGDTVRRIAVDLPASPWAIGRVFAACGRELQAPERDRAPDRENLGGAVWRTLPNIRLPDRAYGGAGLAALRCDVQGDGHLRDCTVESEFPEGLGFGRAAVLAAHRGGRMQLPPGAEPAVEGRRVTFLARYSSTLD